MNVKPLGDRILIKIKESETKTAGGIIIPQTAQEKTQTGVVVAVGTDTDVIKVKAGDEVMYDKYAGTQSRSMVPSISSSRCPTSLPYWNNLQRAGYSKKQKRLPEGSLFLFAWRIL